jgi:hypothetical protein
MPRCAAPLAALFECLKGQCDGVSIADATSIAVCDKKRISRHRVFKDSAKRGKTSMGWFFGFKLHAVINSRGELLRIRLTPGNVDDRKPVPDLCQGLFGMLFADWATSPNGSPRRSATWASSSSPPSRRT